MSDIGLRVLISGVAEARRDLRSVQGDVSGLEGTIRSLSGISSQLGHSLTSLGRSISGMGITLTTALTAPLLAASAALTNAGIQFEAGFAGITKTVDGLAIGFEEIRLAAARDLGLVVTNMDEARAAAAEMGMAFGDLTDVGQAVRDEFRQMSLEIPIPTTELLRLGEVVGQLGVNSDEIAEVTRLISLLGVATDLAAEDAAFGLIRFGNIMHGTALDVEEFVRRAGSAIVALGNSSVSTEGEILNLTLRLAAAGDRAKFSEQEILAWATTLTDLGTRAELGGSAVSRAINEMLIAVQTGSENVATFAGVMGLSVEEFSRAFEEDASAAVLAFVGALEEGIIAGTVTKDMLTEMGLGGIRAIDVIGRLGDAEDIFAQNLNTANVAWAEAIALEEEAEKRFATIESQIQLTKNALTDLGIELFDLVKDKLAVFLESIRTLIQTFKDLDPQQQQFILTLIQIAAALGPVLVVVGTFISLLGGIIIGITALLTPVGLIILALGSIAAALGFIAAGMVMAIGPENIFNIMREAMRGLPALFEIINAKITELAQVVIPFLEEKFKSMEPIVALVVETASRVFTTLSAILSDRLGPILDDLLISLGLMSMDFEDLIPAIGDVIIIIGTLIIAIISGLAEALQFVAYATTRMDELFKGLVDAIVGSIQLIDAIIDFFVAWFTGDTDMINFQVDRIIMAFERMSDGIVDTVGNLFLIIASLFIAAFAGLVTIVTEFVENILRAFGDLSYEVAGGSIIPDMITAILLWFTKLLVVGSQIITTLVSSVAASFGKLEIAVNTVLTSLGTAITRFQTTIITLAATIAQKALNIIASMRSIQAAITSSPELSIQHPFERFDEFLKKTDFSMDLAMPHMPQLSAAMSSASGSSVANTTTSTDRSSNISISGVPLDNARDLAAMLEQRQILQRGFG